MKIGIVRVDAFKKMAWAMKKRIEGCKHGHALENLARACGMKTYFEVLKSRENGLLTDQLLQGSRDELIDAWSERIASQFDVALDAIFTADEIDAWFTKVFVDRSLLIAEAEADDVVMKEIHDPRLGAANWRDAEFRLWVQRIVDLENADSRSRDFEQLDGDGSDKARHHERRDAAHSSRAAALVEE